MDTVNEVSNRAYIAGHQGIGAQGPVSVVSVGPVGGSILRGESELGSRRESEARNPFRNDDKTVGRHVSDHLSPRSGVVGSGGPVDLQSEDLSVPSQTNMLHER